VKERIDDPGLAPRPGNAQRIEKELLVNGPTMTSVIRIGPIHPASIKGKYRFESMMHLIDSNAFMTGNV
jgi:hypothetical protein